MAERATDNDMLGFDEIVTDDENDEVEYEAWKVRELKRLKRDRDEAERLVLLFFCFNKPCRIFRGKGKFNLLVLNKR